MATRRRGEAPVPIPSVPASLAPPKSRTRRRRPKPPPPGSVPRDVVIVGGGLAGLSAALRLALHPSGPPRHVTILERGEKIIKSFLFKYTLTREGK